MEGLIPQLLRDLTVRLELQQLFPAPVLGLGRVQEAVLELLLPAVELTSAVVLLQSTVNVVLPIKEMVVGLTLPLLPQVYAALVIHQQ